MTMKYEIGERVLCDGQERTVTRRATVYYLDGDGPYYANQISPIPKTSDDKHVIDLCKALGGDPHQLASASRAQDIAMVRQAIYTQLRREGWTYSRIGAAMGRDHATVIQGERRFNDLLFIGDQQARNMDLILKAL